MIRQLGAGAYTYLPLGLRVLQKAEQIVRDEMNAAGALELLMPAIQPLELWDESGRSKTMDDILMKVTLGGDKKIVLGPTHEEVITDIARDLIKSYKQLSVILYQIQTKFRNEPRPRFGVVRTREFLMKDAYSFSASAQDLAQCYDSMYEAYSRIFDRCGIPYVAVEAESGPIGGDSSHEFMVPCASGEDVLVRCEQSGYAANLERAEIGAITPQPRPENPPPYQIVPTPNKRTIQDVCAFLKAKPNQSAKLLVYLADGQPIGVLIRGDHEANEAKIRRAAAATTLAPADPLSIEKATGAPMGFLGPVQAKIPILVDQSVAAMPSVVVGANQLDMHLVAVVPGRDFPLDRVGDFRNAAEGDPCPRSGNPMTLSNGMEIGHVFKLGTKYSVAMNAHFLDENQQSHPLIMGCYGIGVNRILAAAVEAANDADGIRWPWNIAPYQAVVIPLQVTNASVMSLAESTASALEQNGVDVLLDDRDLRPGPKFKDADLIGFPLRIVIGERGLADGKIELKWRSEKLPISIDAATATQQILEEINRVRQIENAANAQKAAARSAARSTPHKS
jgi:prolyl-tRNA synthetase